MKFEKDAMVFNKNYGLGYMIQQKEGLIFCKFHNKTVSGFIEDVLFKPCKKKNPEYFL